MEQPAERTPPVQYIVWGLAATVALIVTRVLFGYPVFHTIAELFAVTVAFGTFMVTWNARRYIDNGYLLFVGIAYFFVAGIDVLHMLSYQGVNIFVAYSELELPTQLWLSARYMQAAALLIAPAFVARRVLPRWVFAGFSAASALLLGLVFSGTFPSVLPVGGELTAFKVGSEWVIIAAFAAGLLGLVFRRRYFDNQVLGLLVGSIMASILAEFAFTLYRTPSGIPNFAGHVIRIAAFYFLYRAIIETGIARPFAVLLRDLNATTERLKASETRFRMTFEQATLGIAHLDLNDAWLMVNTRMARIAGYTADELVNGSPDQLTHSDDRAVETGLRQRLLSGEIREYHVEKRYVRPDGLIVWVSVSRSLVRDDEGKPLYFIAIVEDISERKDSEARTTRSRDLSEALNAIARAINSTFDLDEVMRRVTSLGTAVVGADAATVWEHDSDIWVPRIAHGYPDIIVGKRFTGNDIPHVTDAIRAGEPIAVENLLSSYPEAAYTRARQHEDTSVLAIPLESRGEQLGALTFVWMHDTHAFTAEELDFARKLGAALALAIDNSRLYEGERRVADTLQASMLSMQRSVQGLEIAYRYHSATELARIGGDFFDVFELSGDRVAFVIGDVAGKGIRAAALTTIAKSTLRAFAYELEDPAAVCEAANRAILHQVGEGRFITAIFGVIDTKSGVTTVAVAGHPLPLICDELGCTEQAATHNPPLGAIDDIRFETYDVHLKPGMRVVLFSDGLIEARAGSEFLGDARVRGIVDEMGDAAPELVVEALMETVRSMTGGSPSDDIAILAFRYLGP